MLWFLPSLAFGIYLGFSSGLWQMAVMSSLTALILVITMLLRGKDKKVNVDDKVWLSGSGIAIGNHVLPRRSIFWRSQWRAPVWAQIERELALGAQAEQVDDLVARGLAAKSRGSLTATLGLSADGCFEVDLADSGPHLLVTGPTGVGKSQFLRFLLRSLRSAYSTQELQLALVDFKGGSTLGCFAKEAGVWAYLTDLNDSQQQNQLWNRLDEELHAREELFAVTGVADIVAYHSVATPLARLVVVIDELGAALLASNRPLATIESIAARGRSLGVHLICASQSLSGIPRSLVTNLRLRCAIGAVDQIELAQLGGSSTKGTGPLSSRPGWGFGQLVTSGESTRWFEFPFGLRLEPYAFRPRAELPETLPASSEPEPPARLRVRRREYSGREPMRRLLDRLLANRGLQVPARRASLHL